MVRIRYEIGILLFISFIFASFQSATNNITQAVQGIIFDKDNNVRIANVVIYSKNTNAYSLSNLRGEFKIDVGKQDTLFFMVAGYKPYSQKKLDNKDFFVFLEKDGIWFEEIIIRDTLFSTGEKVSKLRKEYRDFLQKGVFVPQLQPGITPGSVGIGIQAIYDYFSKQGFFARRLNKFIVQESEQWVIDTVFTTQLVQSITHLEGEQLLDFMSHYRPTFKFIVWAKPYDLEKYIKRSYRIFKLAGVNNLPSLWIKN